MILNELTAAAAVVLLAMVVWGYRPAGSHFWRDGLVRPLRSLWGVFATSALWWWSGRPDWLRCPRETMLASTRQAIFFGAQGIGLRMAYHDVWRGFRLGIDAFSIQTQLANAGFNMLIVAAALYALRARWQALPEEAHTRYTWLTSVFYPRRADVARAMAGRIADDLAK